MGRAWLNIKAVKARIRQGAEEALETIGDEIASDAKRRAPIRKVFREKGSYRRRFRRLTAIEQALASRRASVFYAKDEFRRNRSLAHIRNYARVSRPGAGSLNALERSRNLRTLGYERNGRFTSATGAKRLSPRQGGGYSPGAIAPMLTARGAYEIRSGRAIHHEVLSSGTIKVQVGGALKASIESEGVSETPQGVEVRITAAIRYAKFVEFPTVHNAAQPFLRPALHAARQSFKGKVAQAIGEALRR